VKIGCTAPWAEVGGAIERPEFLMRAILKFEWRGFSFRPTSILKMHDSSVTPSPRLTTDRAARTFLFSFFLCSFSLGLVCRGAVSIEIDLQDQRAYLLRDNYVVMETRICSGRFGFHTPVGRFTIIEKDLDHHSSIYGKIVDQQGRTLVADADVDMPLPAGAEFVPAPMHYFMRFSGSNGLHSGYLPGYPASHGCVRLPKEKAIALFERVDVGTPVTVFGRTPNRGQAERDDYWERYDPFYGWRLRERRSRGPAPFGWW
jgi:hypothetical protein